MSVLSAQALWSSKRSITFSSPRKNSSVSFAVGWGVFMALTIAGTLVAGKAIAFATVPFYVLAALVWSVRDPTAAICVYFAYAAMEGMFKYLSHFNNVIYIVKPLLLLIIACGWLVRLHRMRRRAQIAPMSKAVAVWLLWGLAQVFHPFGRGIAEGVGTLLLWYGLPALLMVVGHNVFETKEQEERLRMAFVAICTVVSLFGILQFKMGLAWTQSHLPGYETMTATDWWTTDSAGKVTYSAFRPASTTAEGGGGGGWGHFGVLFCLPLLATPGLSLRARLTIASCLLINFVGTMVCGVRIWVMAALFEGIVFILATARSPRELARNLGLGAAAMVVLAGGFGIAQAMSEGNLSKRYGETLSNPFAKFSKDRGENFDYLPQFLSDFPLGIGYQRGFGGRNSGVMQGEILANRETVFNAIADDMGFPGVVIICFILGGLPIAGFRALKRLRTDTLRLSGAIYFAILLGYVMLGLAGPSLQAADFYWLFAGLLTAMPRLEARSIRKLEKPKEELATEELVKAETQAA